MVLYGLGRHKYYLSNYDFKEFLKYDYLDWMQTFITLAISKISICLFLLRLSKFNKLKTVLWVLIGLLVITHLPLTILFLAQCDPVSREWNMSLSGRCFSKHMVENILIAQGGASSCPLPTRDPISTGEFAQTHRYQYPRLINIPSFFHLDRLHWGSFSCSSTLERQNQDTR